MANRHNQFSQLLGGAENDPQPLVGVLPMSGVPDLEGIAQGLEESANWHLESVKGHAQAIRDLGQAQPKFNPQDSGRVDG